jgi:hypothetical protein
MELAVAARSEIGVCPIGVPTTWGSLNSQFSNGYNERLGNGPYRIPIRVTSKGEEAITQCHVEGSRPTSRWERSGKSTLMGMREGLVRNPVASYLFEQVGFASLGGSTQDGYNGLL